jgi:ubiquitin-like 1-activating enzyme E1 A
VQELNPRVVVKADRTKVVERIQDLAFLSSFDLVIATDLDYSSLSLLNTSARLGNKPFYAAGSHGFYGYIFADLIVHDYIREGDVPNIPAKPGQESLTRSITSVKIDNGKQIVAQREIYSPIMLANTSPLPTGIRNNRTKLKKVTPLLSCIRALWEFETRHNRAPFLTGQEATADLREFTTIATEKHNELGLPRETLNAEFLRKFLHNIYSQLAPVTAMLGGLLAQDAINVIGKREQPIQNLCLFDGDDYNTPVYAMHPGNYEDGTALANGTAPVVAAAVASGVSAEIIIL